MELVERDTPALSYGYYTHSSEVTASERVLDFSRCQSHSGLLVKLWMRASARLMCAVSSAETRRDNAAFETERSHSPWLKNAVLKRLLTVEFSIALEPRDQNSVF